MTTPLRPVRRVAPALAAALLVGLAAGCAGQAARPASDQAPKLKDEMRMPWAPQAAGFIRTWLVVGEFPNPPKPGQTFYDHLPPCVGLDTDYLKDQGGEAKARPSAGQAVKRPDGTAAAWTAVTSPTDLVDLAAALPGRPGDNAVAYAFTTIDSPQGREAFLAVGSDDGCRIWLNGKVVHDVLAARGVTPDEDLAPVSLKKGENTLLVKVENGTGGWGFCLRVLSAGQASATRGGGLRPAVVEGKDPAVLSVRTDAAAPAADAEAPAVKVEVIAPGGRVAAMKEVPRGQTAAFDAAALPDGPYEIRCTTTTLLGRREVAHLPWYRGDPLPAARVIVATAAKADAKTPQGMLHRMLAEMIVDRAGGDPAKAEGLSWRQIHSPLMEYAELGDGGQAAVHPYGFVRLAYRDEVDDSPQFCRAYLPAEYDPAKKWPLVVSLHGYNPPNPPYVQWWGADQRHHGLADRYGVIVIEPHGRFNTWYHGIGEKDVLRCVEMARKRFNVDEGRVYLMGYSMGGGGTWYVGTRNTDVFAAIAPIFGGWDYHVSMGKKGLTGLTPAERRQMERESSFAQAESLLTTPVFVNHGDADELVDVDQSRYAVRMLQRWGYDVRYWEHPGKGHGGLGCEDALLGWMLEHRRDPNPAKVRLRAADLAGAHAHWLRVGARGDPTDMIIAEAEILGPNGVRLDTHNALEVTLAPAGEFIDPAKPLKVVWNGDDVRTLPMTDGRVTLQALGYVPGDLGKKPGLEGPLSDARGAPFAIVLGTISPDATMRRLCQRLAERQTRAWETWQHARPRVFKDTEISPDDMARYSLLLIGGPSENLAAKALAGKLPLQVSGSTVTLGGRTFAAPDAAIGMIYPNPLNRDRYVAVTAATSPKGMFLADRLPEDVDFAIVDACMADKDAGRPEAKVRVAAGFFDHAWRLTDTLLETGDPKVRAACPVRQVPAHLSAAVKADSLLLSDVLETAAEGSFLAMGRDRSASGKPLRLGGRTFTRGIAVEYWHETCAAEWDLEGGGWTRLRATLGIEIEDPAKLEPKHKESTRVRFIVKGDGKELFRSGPVRWDSAPQPLDVDVSGVKRLRLEVANDATWFCAASSIDWADLRLER